MFKELIEEAMTFNDKAHDESVCECVEVFSWFLFKHSFTCELWNGNSKRIKTFDGASVICVEKMLKEQEISMNKQ